MTLSTPQEHPHSKFINGPAFVILMGALTAFDPLSIDMYLPAFPTIQNDLGTTISLVELSLSSFFIGMASGQLIYGPLADRFGRKRPLLFGMGLYMLATMGCALSTNIFMLITFRILQAFGGCAGMVVTRAVVRDLFDKKRSAHFFSSMALVMGLAPILAPLMGGYINQALGWRAIFWTLAGANFVCMLSILTFLPETHRAVDATIKVKNIIKGYVSLLKDSGFVGYVAPDAAIRAGMFAYIAGSPFVFIELFHIPQEHFGWIFGTNAFGIIGATQINRFLLRKADSETILRRMLPTAAIASALLFFLPFVIHSQWAVLVPLFFFIMSLGFVGPNSIAGALANQGHRAGMASALYGTLQWSVASFASFLVSRLHNGTMLPMTGVIFGCGIVSFTAFHFLVVRPSRAGLSQVFRKAP